MLLMIMIWFVFVVIIGIQKTIYWKRKYQRCTLKVKAVVIDEDLKKAEKGTAILYRPILQVYLRNQEPYILHTMYTHWFRLEIGETVWIYINPNYVNEFRWSGKYQRIVLSVELGAMMIPLISLIGIWFAQ